MMVVASVVALTMPAAAEGARAVTVAALAGVLALGFAMALLDRRPAVRR
jgi:hypothetical protein